jgi:hypothetical protein
MRGVSALGLKEKVVNFAQHLDVGEAGLPEQRQVVLVHRGAEHALGPQLRVAAPS